MPNMTIGEVYQIAIQVWPEDLARTMTAVAWAESTGNPDADNGIAKGLWQVVYDETTITGRLAELHRLLGELGIDTSEGIQAALSDPLTNAYAADAIGRHLDWPNEDAHIPPGEIDLTRFDVTAHEYRSSDNYYENYFPLVDEYLSTIGVEPPAEEPPAEEPPAEEPPAGGILIPPGVADTLLAPVYGTVIDATDEVIESPFGEDSLFPDLNAGQLAFWTDHFAQEDLSRYGGGTYDFDFTENLIAAEFMQSKMAETEFDINTGHAEFVSDSRPGGTYREALKIFDDHLAGLGWEIEYKPLGWSWMWLWGRENEEVGDFLDDWVVRFNESQGSQGGVDDPAKWTPEVLLDNFLNHPVGGLNAQDWWKQRTGDWENAQQLWYQSQPTGGLIWEDPFPGDYMEIGPRYGAGEGLVEGRGGTLPGTVQPGWFDNDDFAGDPGSEWGNAWQQTKTMVQTTIENMGTGLAGQVSESFVNRMVMELMQNGGATFALGGRDASQWAEEATLMIEAGVREEYLGISAEGSDWGPGRFQDVIDTLNNRLRSQMFTPSPDFIREHGSVEDWAMDIIGGEEAMGTLNLAQRMDFIDNEAWNQATGTFGLTEDDLAALRAGTSTDQYGNRTGGSIRGLLQPLANAANSVWGTMADYKVDDQWLIDNYMVTDENGTRRRNATEMANQARTNRSRFSQSDEYQDWGNKFMAGAAAMFRSDY